MPLKPRKSLRDNFLFACLHTEFQTIFAVGIGKYFMLFYTPRNSLISLLEFYQKHLSCMLPRSCRFWPSCSEYAKQAVSKYGLLKGAIKTAGRLSRCQPLSGQSGYDPMV